MNKYKVILFDLDGTILDTSVGIAKSINTAFLQNGYKELDGDEIKNFIGPPVQDSFLKYLNLSKEEAWRLATDFRAIYIKDYLFEAALYNGLMELLIALKSKNYKLAIATSKREDYTKTILKHFDLYDLFDVIKGSDYEGKLTKSDIVKCVINQFPNYGKGDFVMIGDTEHDRNGSVNNEIDFIGVTYGFGFMSKDDNNQDTLFVNNAQELAELF
ncbi:MAG: HAD hydrolase-like protein [Rikenellaceae bacterium]